jgi:hypothetical protein
MKTIIIGDPHKFAIESCIARAYERLSFRALGYFVLHVKGRPYGVKSIDATMLACSLDEVQRRISRRGGHTAFFSQDSEADLIASAVDDSIYGPENQSANFRGLPQRQLRELVYSHHLQWAPDGDEAFDDSSRVLHFDVDDRIRIIAYTVEKDHYRLNPQTLRDQWLDADEFYGVLERWCDAFETEWLAAPKVSEES